MLIRMPVVRRRRRIPPGRYDSRVAFNSGIDGVLIDVLSREDVAGLESLEPPGRGFVRAMWEQQQRGECILLVAWHGRSPVGSGQVVWSDPSELRNLNVPPTWRGRGIGADVIAAAEALVGSGRWLAIGVGIDNPRAHALYERLGYVDLGERTTSTYQYVDDDGVSRTATETDTRLIKQL